MLDAKTPIRVQPGNTYASGQSWENASIAALRQAPSPDGPDAVHQNMPVSRIMTAEVVSFAPDTDIETATQTLLSRGISGAPIVDATLTPTGMVSKTDLLEAWQQRAKSRAQHDPDADSPVHVGDIMVPYLLAISHRAPISLATALMAYEGVHRLVVLGENNKMVGIVTSLDVVRWVADFSGFNLSRTTRLQRALG